MERLLGVEEHPGKEQYRWEFENQDNAEHQIIENLNQMVQAIRDGGRQPIILNVPYANESMFPRTIAEDLHRMRDYHNERLPRYCMENQVPLVDIASKLRDEHFGDELHPNDEGAQVIATEVYRSIAGFTLLSQ